MNKITEITSSGGIVIIKAEGDEGEEKFLVAKEFYKNFGLAEGDALGDDDIEALSSATTLTAACRKALDALSRSDVSRRALTDRLVMKYKFDRETAEQAAEYAARRGFLDEERQAKEIARRAVATKNHGRRLVVAELLSKGFPKDVAVIAADEVPEEEYTDALRRALAKKSGDPRKVVASLVRLGHSPRDAARAVKEKISEDQDI